MTLAADTRLAALSERRHTSFIGMSLMLGSWAMLFASLFFAYAVVRFHAPAWPPDGVAPLPRALPAVNTLVLLLSSVVLGAGTKRGRLGAALLGTTALGALFLALQLAVWIPLWRSGLTPSSGIYGSVFYALTLFHALHVLAGLGALAALLPVAARGELAARASRVRLTAMFWHFVDLVWVVMFVAIYLA